MTAEFICEYCDSEHTNASALMACELQCELDRRNTRQWFSGYDPHRKD